MWHVKQIKMADENAKKDFATIGTEAFKIADQEVKKGHIVLNIQEEKPEGVVLEEKKAKGGVTGNIVIDFLSGINRYLLSHSKVKIKDKATFFHLLAVMINAGIPMIRALKSLISQLSKTPRLRLIIEKLVTGLKYEK